MIDVPTSHRTNLRAVTKQAGVGGVIGWHTSGGGRSTPVSTFRIVEIQNDAVVLDGLEGNEKDSEHYRLGYHGHEQGDGWSVQCAGKDAPPPKHEIRCGDCQNIVAYSWTQVKEPLCCSSCAQQKGVRFI